MNPARNHPDLHAKHGMAQVDFEMRYKTQAIADLEDVVHQSQKEASARGLDALLAAADAQGEGEEAWVMKDAEAKGLLRECLKRVLLLEEVARKRDKEREALEMEVCVCVCVWRGVRVRVRSVSRRPSRKTSMAIGAWRAVLWCLLTMVSV